MMIRGVLGFVITGGWALPMTAQDFHTEPSCWSGPRIYHVGASSDDVMRKIERTVGVTREARDSAVISSNGAYAAWVEIPNTPTGNIADQILYVASEQDRVTRFYIEQAQLSVTPRWINEKLVFARIQWGRMVFTDVIIDAESGEMIYQEEARDGQIAYEQFRQACNSRCPCDVNETVKTAPPLSAPARGEVIGYLQIDRLLNRPSSASPGLPIYVDVQDTMQKLTDINDPGAIVTDGNEEWESAHVYAERPGWYQIRLSGRAERLVWVRAEQVQAFTPLTHRVRDGLSYLGSHWDGRLWSSPDGTGGYRVSPLYDPGLERPEYAASVTALKETSTGPWFQVTLHDGDDCTRSEETIVDTGWVPAWSEHGKPLGEFYAKGC